MIPSQLLGIFLRFRIERIAIASDVEKAFLQVRLYEVYRDATRCLWLYDHKSPPFPNNIKTLRFARVIFGLNKPPFFLAGTVRFHLGPYKEEAELISQHKDNLYADNLVVTVDELEEAFQSYLRIKQIFNDFNMNLREFASNNIDLMERIPSVDKADSKLPKVLGIPWNIKVDCLQITCMTRTNQRITKRTMASTLASVYEPMSFLKPLLHKAKVFLRSPWKDKYNWDHILPDSCKDEWITICTKKQGFTKPLPRCLGTKNAKYILVTFADASVEALTTCIYLRCKNATNLLMAKSKLSLLKSASTVRRMELDAVTLALRLTNAVLTQLQWTLEI
ncbi:unnamed protein product [Angiostrongylus costaricensis]|uniref:Reverse transcriptase domain-containing protein n=1 Tax=Angiostrongylus costaricensis TaxID=334426 RepID=A0A0R3PAP6_ANGCS|nr:unnamed protein product [Angiostrongylus costaricensis]